ncbi:hypothetical protein C8035_v008910 [Colletotrichum spinosum]|uniref:Uncharacterized protein n=1 Tax=Colletotrichum spinosum TaxID=1347390 RepID=A0A4R8Q9Y4_9PEZI|nr:hypothetical protein C8035_v008910 [Colletotrichum spinosum]
MRNPSATHRLNNNMAPSGRSSESDQAIKRTIIGIGGNVCSGKSTLAGAILQAFEEVCHEDCKPVGISVDDFIRYTPDPERFWTQDEYPTSLSAVDWVKLNDEITRVLNGKAVKPYHPLVLHDKRSNDRVRLNKTELKRHLTQLGHILKDDKIQIVVVEGSQLCMKGDQDGWPNGRAKPSSLGQEPIMDDEQKRARDDILDRFLFRYYLYTTKSRSRDRVFRLMGCVSKIPSVLETRTPTGGWVVEAPP